MATIQTTFGFKDQMTQGLSLLNNTLTSMNKTLAQMQNQMSGANQAISEIKQTSEQAAGSVSNLGSGLLTFNAAIGVFNSVKGAVDSVTASINEMNEAYNYQMTQENKLATVMTARMGATEAQIQSIKDYASALQSTGVIGDEVQLAGAQELATYISDVNTLKALMPVLNDIAVQASPDMNVTGQQMSNLATMLGKVMGGELGGMSHRGWVFTEEEKAQFKEMTEMQRAQFLAAYAQDAIGSQNQNAALTAAGQVIQLQNTFGDLKEEIGRALVPYQQFFQISTMKWKIKFMETIVKALDSINKHPLLKALITGAIVAAFTAIGVIIVASVIPALTGIIAQLTIIQAFSGPIGWVALAIGAVVGAAVLMEGAFDESAKKIDECAKSSSIWVEDISNVKTSMETIKEILNDTSTAWYNNISQEAVDAYKTQVREVADSLDSMLEPYGLKDVWRNTGAEQLEQVLRENSFSKSEIKMISRLKENYDMYSNRARLVTDEMERQTREQEKQFAIQKEMDDLRKQGLSKEEKIAEAYARTKQGQEEAKIAELNEYRRMLSEGGYKVMVQDPFGNASYAKHSYTAEQKNQLRVIIKELEESLKEGKPIPVEDKGLVDIAADYRELLSKQATERFNLRFSQTTPQVTFGDVNINSDKDGENILERFVDKMEEAAASKLGVN